MLLTSAVAVDQRDEDVGEQARDVEGHQRQHQVMLLFGDEQVLALSPSPGVCADLVRAVLLGRVALAAEERLLLVGLVHYWNWCWRMPISKACRDRQCKMPIVH